MIGADVGERNDRRKCKRRQNGMSDKLTGVELTSDGFFCHHRVFSIGPSVLAVCKMVPLICYYSFFDRNV